jgi:hypothetical protein
MQVHDKKIIICDLDGTIANVQHRLHYIKNADGTKKKHKDTDWNSFHKACVDDEPYKDVIEILQSLVLGMGNGCNVCGAVEREFYFFSGRNEAVRSETIEWLKRHVPITEDWHWELYMRSEGDRRPDTTVKYEMMYELKIMPEDVLCILDDRQSVVDMWRANGFRVMQVDAWKEESVGDHHYKIPQERTEGISKRIALWMQRGGKGTPPTMMEPIPMIDTPDFDLGDIQEDEK